MFGNSDSKSYTLNAGQTLETDMEENKFTISLGVSKKGPKFSVVDPVEFWVIVRLNTRREPMSLKLRASLKYRWLVSSRVRRNE
jgi:hypothetical protein